jgi:Trk K+ transport system NAD-binding subunit
MNGLATSPFRNLISILVFLVVITVLATGAYMSVGWSFTDAFYMVLLTLSTVGYGEVHPINTPFLHAVTMGTIVLGYTGMILMTSSLVQVFTYSQIQQLLGENRVKTDINKLKGHVIVCGFGRIGVMLAKELAAGGSAFVILDRDEERVARAKELGYLGWVGDGTDEKALSAVGIERARVLATVLPNDAANVFITLSARSLNPSLHIIARGEEPSTENKLIHAGADKVVLPTHIGAERIAEMILFPETARFIRESEGMEDFEKVLRDLGLEIEVVIAAENTASVGLSITELEGRAKGAFIVVQLNRRDGKTLTKPSGDIVIEAGDGLVVVGRDGSSISALFTAPATRPRAGRNTY